MAMTRTAACGGRIEHMTLKGRERQAAWTRERVLCLVSLIGLLFATGLLYIINLDASGYANQFYSAAAQAGSTNWWSFLWGSSDAGNSITVDKPPAAIWPMALSVKIFGLSSWSILLPQAVMGVLSTWLLYAAVKRVYGHWAGILASAALAVPPIACLMFQQSGRPAYAPACQLRILHSARLPAAGRESGKPQPDKVDGPGRNRDGICLPDKTAAGISHSSGNRHRFSSGIADKMVPENA